MFRFAGSISKLTQCFVVADSSLLFDVLCWGRLRKRGALTQGSDFLSGEAVCSANALYLFAPSLDCY